MVGCGYKPLVALAILTILGISNCEDYMEKFRVVPDMLDKSPPATLEVVYPCNVKVEEGKELTPTQVKNQPTVKWPSEDGIYYLLILVGLDGPIPQNPTNREFQYWIVGNIPNNDLSKGETMTEFIGSAANKNCGFYRFVFVLYKQPSKIIFIEKKISNTTSVGRPKFSTRNFAKKYNLGEPVAGNLYRAKWDSYIPIYQKQMGFPTVTCPVM